MINNSTFKSFVFITLTFYLILGVSPHCQAGTTSEQLVAQTIPFTQHPANPTQWILVAGDSTAVGVGSLDPKMTIAGRLGQEFPRADIANYGISGARLKDLLRVLNYLSDNYYDLIVLQIGANDVTHFTSYGTVRNELSKVLSLCNQMSPKTILLTAGDIGNAPIFFWPVSTMMTARTKGVRKIFIEEASKYQTVHYIDLFNDTKDNPFAKDINKYYAPDHFHLTGEGYGIWYYYVRKAL